MIPERQMLVLKAIVEEYVRTAEPVGSKFLSTLPSLNFSSATIRNDMVNLEEAGLIYKTHTSSGRVPTEEGYRLYVKGYLKAPHTNQFDYPMIDEIFERDIVSKEQAIKEAMKLVTELTNYATIVLGSSSYQMRIKRLEFIPMDERHGVILMVTDKGYVESKKILIPEAIKAKDIERVIKLLNELLVNVAITDIDDVLKEKLQEAEIRDLILYYEKLVGVLVRAFTSMAQDKYFLSGQTNILSLPEFQDIDKVKDLVSAIENQEILQVVNIASSGITVKIGRENTIKAMQDCTVITVPYEYGNNERGAIAVFGPTRMEYQKVIPLLEYIAQVIKKMS